MPPDEIKKLNDTIAFSNSIAQQFYVFQRETRGQIEFLDKQIDEIGLKLGRLQEEMGRLQAENKELKTLIDANRSWVQICESRIVDVVDLIDELRKTQHTHGTAETKPVVDVKIEAPIKFKWPFWK